MEEIKNLREKTGAGIMQVKKALEEAGGDTKKAEKILIARGVEMAEKKADRATCAGLIDSYIHLGKVGAMVEVNCETDFVARNEQFKAFVHEVALQVSTSEAKDVDELMKEPYFKDQEKTIDSLLKEVIAKTGENIKIKRFVRYTLGE